MAIKAFQRLRGLGVFVDHTHSADVPEFRRYNLIYGFNGSGKTTLSRLLRSIEAQALSSKLPSACDVKIALADGATLTQENLASTLSGKILVFNEDFVEDNLRWQDGTVSPVFYIGKEQAQLSRVLEICTDALDRRSKNKVDAGRAQSRADSEVRAFKRDRAALIAEELALGRQYIATALTRDYENFDLKGYKELSEEQRKAERRLILQTAPAADIVPLSPLSTDISDTVKTALDVCAQSLGASVVDGLKDHPSMLGWISEGLDYHSANNLGDCLFCGQEVPPGRFETLSNIIDDKFRNVTEEVGELSEKIGDELDGLAALELELPSKNDLSADLSADFESKSTAFGENLKGVRRELRKVKALLDAKAKTPNLAAQTDKVDLARLEFAVAGMKDARAAIDELIENHNSKNATFSADQENARLRLKAHYLIESQAKYDSLVSAVEKAERNFESAQRLQSSLESRIERVKEAMRSHGPAVPAINDALSRYLGHHELTLQTADEGYEILRNGTALEGPLSEGERTALAVCYFLSKLEENGRQLKDAIVVVDDPVSSLDSKAMNYAFNLLRQALEGASQVFFLTHNIHFMNETKKWLKSRADPVDSNKQPTATLLFIETVGGNHGGQRQSAIRKMPKLLRDYDSEYHYLMSMMLTYVDDPEGASHLTFLMPNVLRKVLEVFLAFKSPGADGLESKLNHPVVRDSGVDPAALAALARLAQVESHGDSIDDLVALPPMTVEETRSAAEALVALMKVMDEHHLKRMRKLSA